MNPEPFDGAALYAARGQARNGSPFASDRDYRRPVSFGRLVFRAVRDGLAIMAFLAIFTVAVLALFGA